MGISFIFVTSFGRYPCRRWYAFSSGKFSAHRLRILTVRSPWSVTALSTTLFSFTAVREPAVYRTISNTVGLQRELLYCDRFLSVTLFLFWLSAFLPWSKLRVIIWSMLRFRTTLHIPFANVFPSFELLLHKCPSYAHFQRINGKYILNLIWGNKSKTKKSIPYIRITRKP